MDLKSYNNYTGKFTVNLYTEPVKKCHQIIKNFIITKFSNNIYLLIDIGSGRGHDYDYWHLCNIKRVIGIEPSDSSIESAIKKYSKQSKINKYPKITYIKAIGNMIWKDGTAGLDDKSKLILQNTFKQNLQADCIHLFWTIHYCMDTKKDFLNLFSNIDANLKNNGKVIILSMNGKLINKLIKENNGYYKNTTDTGEIIFELKAYYDYNKDKLSPYGNTIGVKLAGTYGLDNEIKENLVFRKHLIDFFQKNNYKLIIKQNFVTFAENNNIECLQNFNIYQKRISVFYDIIIFDKST
jgi:SAM-dependent methyltransferase